MTRPAFILVALAAVATAASPDRGDWSAVNRLTAGTLVEVIHRGLQRSTGKLVEANDNGVTIESGGSSHTIARAGVRRISISSQRRSRRAVAGLALGAAGGAALMLVAAMAGDIDIRYDYLLPAGAVLGAGAGAGIAASTGRRVTIYRAR
jgi:hypothetical protein